MCLALLVLPAALAAGTVMAAGETAELQSIRPTDKKRLTKGTRPTFTVRIPKGAKVGGIAGRDYAVFLRVSRSAKKAPPLPRSKKGDPRVIGGDALVAVMKQVQPPRGRTFIYTPRRYSNPNYWLNEKGTVYWQAYYIYCVGATCVHPSRVKSLYVGR